MQVLFFWNNLFIGIIFIIVAIPLILQRIPPNRYYGVRTAKIRNNAQVWYAVNKRVGVGMFWVGIAMTVSTLLLFFLADLNSGLFFGGVILIEFIGIAALLLIIWWGWVYSNTKAK